MSDVEKCAEHRLSASRLHPDEATAYGFPSIVALRFGTQETGEVRRAYNHAAEALGRRLSASVRILGEGAAGS
jgi:hypothetical protein